MRRQDSGQTRASDARQVRYDQREHREAKKEQRYSRSPFGSPLRASAREWIECGHRA
jgi:hypothetical protein